MSHDELLPDAAPPHEEAVADRVTVQEPSPSDAPPAAPVRRRRTKAAGTDAASAPETTVPSPSAEKPARATRSRKTTPAAPPVPVPAAEVDNAPAAAMPAAPARRTRRTRAEIAAAEIPDAPSAEPVPSAAETAAPETATETPKRRTRRPKAETPAALSEAAPAAEPVAELPVSESAAAIAPDGAKPSRRRTPRLGKNTPAEPITDSVAEIPASEILPADETMPMGYVVPVTEDAPETPEPETDRPRRRRGNRRRRDSANETTTPAAPLVSEVVTGFPAAEPGTDLPGSESVPATERTRRNRRGGRTRRGREEVGAAATEEAAVILAPVIEREPEIDRSVGAHLIARNGQPEIHINDTPYPPVLFFGNMDEDGAKSKVLSEVRFAARAGVHLHSTLFELPCPLTETSNALDKFDSVVRAVLDADPEGYVMPRLVFVPARGWKREYPTDMVSYAEGTGSDPSLTSERFWQEAERALTTLITHVRENLWGQRVFGYHLERGEWFQPLDGGYDRSIANRDAFRDWLREKYHNDLVGLRAAWYDGEVQFHTAEIPPLVTRPNPQRAFYETRRGRRYIDFNEFTSESTANRLVSLAKSAKKAARHQALISVCYGYTFEFGHDFSGHLALDRLLASPHIDILSGPPSYRDRKPGGAASIPAPVDSLLLHGQTLAFGRRHEDLPRAARAGPGRLQPAPR